MSQAAPQLKPEIDRLSVAVRNASTLTEEKFLEIGKRLESSIEILGRLTAMFGKLMVELDGEEINGATQGLSEIATQVPTLADSRKSVRDTLDRLVGLTGTIDRRVHEMRNAVKSINILVINARIAAAGIGDKGADFMSFVGGISRSLKLAEQNLDHFKGELTEVGRHVGAAKSGETDFDARHAGAIRSIPGRLSTNIDAIGTRRRQAAKAAAQVETRSRDAGTRIGGAVMSLQIGDATRQRIEHVQEAAELFTEVLGAGRDWGPLSDSERNAVVASGCRLQALQLEDMAAEFDRDVSAVLSALQHLAKDAREIVSLGSSALGASDRRGDSFLQELESDVSAARALLEGFKASHASANEMMSSVLDATKRLSTHIGTVQSLEADIRIMGFNTTLKCAKLGDIGKALNVIAHELRAHSHRTAVEAEAITGDVDSIVGHAKALSGRGQSERVEDIATIMMSMSDSIAQLRAAGDTLANALHALTDDGDRVAVLLDETVSRMMGHKEIGAALRDAAAGFGRLADGFEAGQEAATEARQRLFAKLAESYTMARERDIHEVVAKGGKQMPAIMPVARAPAPAAEAAVEDLLF